MSPRPSSRRSDGNLGIGLVLLLIVGLIGACAQGFNNNASRSTTHDLHDEVGTPSRME